MVLDGLKTDFLKCLVWFYAISTIEGYLIPNPFYIYIYIYILNVYDWV